MTENTAIADALDEVLCRWHQWQRVSTARGFASRSLVCGEYRISRQYDDANGALDSDLEQFTMKTVEFQVGQMVDPFRSAIYANARALVTGVSVWSSPRLPLDRAERAVIVTEARRQLTKRLQLAGVL